MHTYTKNILAVLLILSLFAPITPFLPAVAHAQVEFQPDAGSADDFGESESSQGSSSGGSSGGGTAIGAGVGAAAGSALACFFGGALGAGLSTGVGIAAAVLAVPVFDLSVSFNTGSTAFNTASVQTKECILDSLVVLVREVAIASITRSIVNWINSGFEGEPAFISDFEGFLLDIGDQVAGAFIEGSELAFLCSPFNLNIRISIALNYYAPGTGGACTLTGVLENIEGAFDNVANGGWDTWFELSVNPYNNPVGSYISSKQALTETLAIQQYKEEQKLAWGNGFRSYEVCDTEGALDPRDSANISVGRVNCRIATPGAVINSQLNESLDTGLTQLELADEINEIIGALLGQLTQQIFGGSSGGFRSLSRSRAAQPSYLDSIVEDASQRAEEGLQTHGVNVIERGIEIEEAFIDFKEDSLALLTTSEDLLDSLAQCYLDKTTAPQSLTSAQRNIALARAKTATSTIAASITPLKTLAESEIEQSENVISRLLVIRENLLDARTLFEVEDIFANELDPFLATNIVHDESDLSIAAQQVLDIENITDPINAQAQADINTCLVFPPTNETNADTQQPNTSDNNGDGA